MKTQRIYRYLHWDVFTDQPLTGNQLAVFPNAQGLDATTMQAIALEMAFSETTFVFPPENRETNFRVRIFTPRAELPMAGHPTIGTTFALAHDGTIAKGQTAITLGLGIGPVPVSLEWSPSELHFAWMTQQLPQFGTVFADVGGMAAALGIEEGAIRNTNLPIQIVSCGVPFLFVPLASRAAVNAAQLERGVFQRVCAKTGTEEPGVFVFSPERANDDATVFSRMFAPGFGVAEDPATGGASGPLGCYLVNYGVVEPDEAAQMINVQGVKMGRPSRIYISIDVRDERIHQVQVGGQAVLVGEGTINL